MVAITPRTIVSGSTYDVPPPRSGRKPEAIAVYCAGNGVIGTLLSTIWVRPRKVSIPASVTMKAGIPI